MGWRQLGVPLGGTLGAAVLPALAALGGVRLAMAGAGVAATATALAFAVVSDGRPAASIRSPGQSVAGVLRIPGFKPLLAVGLLYVLGLGAILAHYVGALRDAGLSHAEAAAGFAALNITAALSRLVVGPAGRRRRRDEAGADAARDRHPHRLRLVRHARRALDRRSVRARRRRGAGVRGVRLQRRSLPACGRAGRRHTGRARGRDRIDGRLRDGRLGRTDRRCRHRANRLRRGVGHVGRGRGSRARSPHGVGSSRPRPSRPRPRSCRSPPRPDEDQSGIGQFVQVTSRTASPGRAQRPGAYPRASSAETK